MYALFCVLCVKAVLYVLEFVCARESEQEILFCSGRFAVMRSLKWGLFPFIIRVCFRRCFKIGVSTARKAFRESLFLLPAPVRIFGSLVVGLYAFMPVVAVCLFVFSSFLFCVWERSFIVVVVVGFALFCFVLIFVCDILLALLS